MRLFRNAASLALVGIVTFAATTAIAAARAADKEEESAKLPMCPVMDEAVDFTIKSMTDDGPVFFCCEGCIKKFEANPEKYSKKTDEQRKMLKARDRVQVACPLSGEPIDKKMYSEKDGTKVYFCCNNCKSKYEADSKKYEGKLEASYVYQTKCPVMGEEIDPTSFADLPTGQRVYLCCQGCEKKLLNDPAKYAPRLAKQGVNVDVKKLKAHQDEHAGHGHP